MKYTYCVIGKDGCVEVSNNGLRYSPAYETMVHQAEVETEGGKITINGQEVREKLIFSRLYATEEGLKALFHESEIKYGHKNLIHWILGRKRPYVSGWVQLKETTPFHWESTSYTLTKR